MQLAATAVVILVCAAAFAVVTVRQLRTQAEVTGLAIARTVATDPQVRTDVAAYSAQTAFATGELENGPLQRYADAIVDRSDVLFVVIANDRGLRLAHPNVARLGEELSTPYDDVLAGEEVIAWERGTLGEALRAKVPIYDTHSEDVIGEVSVGIAPSRAFANVPLLAGITALIVLVALLMAAVVAAFIRRRLERLTRGVQPEEIAGLLQSRAAILDGVGEAVLVLDRDGRVRAANSASATLLGIAADSDVPVTERDIAPELARMILRALGGESVVADEVAVGDRLVDAEARDVRHGDEDLGVVVVARDRTDIIALSERLDSVRAATNALRAQRHEFANRLHVVGGLIAAGRTDDAQDLIAEFATRGALPEEAGLDIADDFLRSFLVAKRIEATERGVELRLDEDAMLLGTVIEAEDVAAVLGNLIDNAMTAAVAAPEPRWVWVSVLDAGDELALAVADSGAGVADPDALFVNRSDTEHDDRVHGRGIGLLMARRFTRRRGGNLWLAERGGAGSGAVFAARMPGVMKPREIEVEE